MQPLSCRRCGTAVLVEKYSMAHTSVQWPDDSRACPEFIERAALFGLARDLNHPHLPATARLDRGRGPLRHTRGTGLMRSSLGHRLRVAAVVRETQDSVSVAFDVPAALADRFRHLPGQFLTLRIPVPGGGWAARCYSLSSAPGDGPPTITVKRVQDGLASNWICDTVQPGSEIEVLPPAGLFAPQEEHQHLLLLAGGSGITPIMSILRSRLAQPGTSAVLIYANRDEQSVIFGAELRKLTAMHASRLLVIHLLESVQGLPTTQLLAQLCAPFAASDAALLCGPGPFMDAASTALAEAGMTRERIVTEKFRSLDSDPFAFAGVGGAGGRRDRRRRGGR